MVVGIVAAAGCAPQFQTQMVGHSTVMAAAPQAITVAAVAADLAVPESHSAQVLRYTVSLPRAVQLRYQVTCPTAQREGTIGETFDSYRTRRLAELERERQAQANLIGSLVGSVAPPIRAQAGIVGPGTSASATAEANPGAGAAAAARQLLPARTLPAGDVGATIARGSVELGASPAGRCAMTLAADPDQQDVSGARLSLELIRLVDIEAEARARQTAIRAEQDKQAMALRIWFLGSLQRRGADPTARARAQARAEEERARREKEAAAERERREAPERARRAKAQRELTRKRDEARAKSERDAEERRAREWRARQVAFSMRWQMLARLQSQGADPLMRQRMEEARIEARREEQRRQYEARAKQQLDVEVARREAIELRLRLTGRLAALGADPDFRRKRDEAIFRDLETEASRQEAARLEAEARVRWETQAALDLRVLTKLRLRQMGAVDRPTCPPPPAETPPPAPFAGATWISGRYDWDGLAWLWSPGHYERPPQADSVWIPPAEIAVSGTLVVRPGRWVRITIGAPPYGRPPP